MNWDVTQEININDAFIKFHNILRGYVVIPFHKIICKPWFIKGLLKSSKTLDKLYKKKLRQLQEHISHKQYKEYRNLYNTLKRAAKEDHYASLLNNYKHDIKQTCMESIAAVNWETK